MNKHLFKRISSVILCVIMCLSCFGTFAFALNATVVTAPKQTTFYQGIDWNYADSKIALTSSIDLTGTKLLYNSKTYSYSVDDIFGPNMYIRSSTGLWAVGNNTANIYCDDFNSSVYATISLNFVAISKVEIERLPINTDLIAGTHWVKGILGDVEISSYDMTGVIIKVTYTDSTVKEISAPNTALGWSIDQSLDVINPGAGKLYITFADKMVGFDVNFLETAPSYSLGDVSMDNKISSYDGLMILEYVVNLNWFNNTQLSLADVSKDGKITSTDSLYILQKVVGLRESF